MFQVRDGFSDETLLRINAALEAQFWKRIAWYPNCAAEGLDYHQTVMPRFLNARLLSVSIWTEEHCYGMFPTSGDTPLNLDIESGKELLLEDLLWLGEGEPHLPRDAKGNRIIDDREFLFHYEARILEPWLIKTLARFYPEVKEEDDCDLSDYSLPDSWKHPVWYLTGKGIYFSPNYPRVLAVCNYPKWSTVPWDIINQHPGRLKNLP